MFRFRALLLILAASPSLAAPVDGPASVVDGDTLHVGAVAIRLCGIDAPELGSPAGAGAALYLMAMLYGRPVHCVPVGEGTPCDHRSPHLSFGRVVAQCFVGDADVAAEMVRRGYACDWPKYSGGAYAGLGCTVTRR